MAERARVDAETRSRPQQARSRRRYQAIVGAAGGLFSASGFDKTTMEAIAAAAGTSIGSVYRFFPHKRAVFRAVAEQAMERLATAFAALLSLADAGESWETVLDAALDGFAALHRDDATVRALVVNMQLYGEYAEADERQLRAFASATTELIRRWAPRLAARERRTVAMTLVSTISGVLLFAPHETRGVSDEMLAHAKLMLRAYLSRWVGG